MRNDDQLPSPSGGIVKVSCIEGKKKELHLHIKAKTSPMYELKTKKMHYLNFSLKRQRGISTDVRE